MRYSRTLVLAFSDLGSHAFRSFLTALGVIFGVGAVVAMMAISEGASRAALEAIEAMGLVPGEETFNFLTAALRNPSASTRAAAVTGLGMLKDPKAYAFLDHRLQQETDENVREKIRGAMTASRS